MLTTFEILFDTTLILGSPDCIPFVFLPRGSISLMQSAGIFLFAALTTLSLNAFSSECRLVETDVSRSDDLLLRFQDVPIGLSAGLVRELEVSQILMR